MDSNKTDSTIPTVVKMATVELAIKNKLMTCSTRLRARSAGEIARQAWAMPAMASVSATIQSAALPMTCRFR